MPLGDGAAVADEFARVLTHLGYRGVALVRKRRRVYHLKRDRFALEVTLDAVEEVGTFAEVEIVAPEADLDAGRTVLLETAKELGLGASERRSYLEMLLAAKTI